MYPLKKGKVAQQAHVGSNVLANLMRDTVELYESVI